MPRPQPAGPPPLPPPEPKTHGGVSLPRPAKAVPATRDTPRPGAPNEPKPVRFGDPAPSAPGAADLPSWARAAGPTLSGWSPTAEAPPAKPAPAKPETSTAPPPRARSGPQLDPGETMPEPASPTRAAPEEPRVPEGMVLISEDELVRRELALTDALRLPYLDAAERMLQLVGEIEQRLRDDTVDLAAQIAHVLMQRAVKIDRTITLGIAQRALRLLGPVERVVVKCAEMDAEYLRERLPELARAEVGRAVEVMVRPSDDIQPGGVLLTFDAGVIDAREERRLERIAEAVRAAVQDDDARALVDVALAPGPEEEPP